MFSNRQPSRFSNYSSELVLPNRPRALAHVSAECALTNRYTLLKHADQSLTLAISLQVDQYNKVNDHLNSTHQTEEPFRTAELVRALRAILPPNERRIPKPQWACAAIKLKSQDMHLDEAQQRTVKAILLSISDSKSKPFASSPIAFRITSRVRMPIVGSASEAPELRMIRTKLDQAISANGRSTSNKWSVAIIKAEATWKKVEKVFAAHHEGRLVSEIVKTVGIERPTVVNWLEGNIPQDIAACMVIAGTHEPLKHKLPAPLIPSVPWAALLGSYQGVTRIGGNEDRLVFHLPTAETAKSVNDFFVQEGIPVDTFGILFMSRQGPLHDVQVNCRSLCRALSDLTDQNRQIPMQYLSTQDEIISYLRSFLAVRVSTTKDGIRVASENNYSLLVAAASLLESLDIPVGYFEDRSKAFFSVTSNFGLTKLLSLNLLPEVAKEAVTKLCTASDSRHPCEAYDLVMGFLKTDPGLSIVELAARAGAEESSVANWKADKNIPRAVKNRSELRVARQNYGITEVGVVPFLMREWNMTVEDAYKVGRECSLSELPQLAQGMVKDGFDPKTIAIDDLLVQIRYAHKQQ